MQNAQDIRALIEQLKKVDLSIQAKNDPSFAESTHPYLIDETVRLLGEYAELLESDKQE